MPTLGILSLAAIQRIIPINGIGLIPVRHKSQIPTWFRSPSGAVVVNKEKLELVPDLHEPKYLKELKPPIGFYDLLDLQIRGYDYVSLERYQGYLHKTMKKMGFTITKSWSAPHQDLVIETLKDRSTGIESNYKLKVYERNLQLKEATVKRLPILIEVINTTIPPGVSFHLHRHTKEDEDKIHFRDLALENLKGQLQELKDTPLIGVSV